MNRIRAYSLVELMVVVGILAILSGILLPIAGRARMNDRCAVCTSNLRQIWLAYQIMAMDRGVDLTDLSPFLLDGSHHDEEGGPWIVCTVGGRIYRDLNPCQPQASLPGSAAYLCPD